MFTIYSMPGCSYCRQVKQLMELTEQKHVVYTLDEDFTIEEFESNFNTRLFPQVVYNKQHLGGCQETVAYLREQNLV